MKWPWKKKPTDVPAESADVLWHYERAEAALAAAEASQAVAKEALRGLGVTLCFTAALWVFCVYLLHRSR